MKLEAVRRRKRFAKHRTPLNADPPNPPPGGGRGLRQENTVKRKRKPEGGCRTARWRTQRGVARGWFSEKRWLPASATSAGGAAASRSSLLTGMESWKVAEKVRLEPGRERSGYEREEKGNGGLRVGADRTLTRTTGEAPEGRRE